MSDVDAIFAKVEASNGDGGSGAGDAGSGDAGAGAGNDAAGAGGDSGDAGNADAGKPTLRSKAKTPLAKEDAAAVDAVHDASLGVDGDGSDAGGGDGEGEGDAAHGKRGRSKPLTKRLSEETQRRREAEDRATDLANRIAALEANSKPAGDAGGKTELVEPKPDDFEFAEADPDYQAAHNKWLIEKTLADRDEQHTKQTEEARFKTEFATKLNTRLAEQEQRAKAKYDDFDERIAEAVQLNGPLSPMTSLGIAVSPVGGDLAYRLATDDDASDRLERLAKAGPASANAFALALGELEGEYIEGTDDSDLDMSDQLDMARMMGRMRARLAGGGRTNGSGGDGDGDGNGNGNVRFTQAPEPPSKRVNGSSSRTPVAPDTEDTKAFWRDHAGDLG